MNNKLLNILENILGQGKQSGHEWLFYCPFCSHHKPKLSINLGDKIGNWKCWVCSANGRKLYYLFKKLNVPKQIIQELKNILSEDIKNNAHDYLHDDSAAILKLPDEYEPLWIPSRAYEYTAAINYLKNRNITQYDILRYSMGYCKHGLYQHRIIIPSYDKNNQLNYFVGRSYYDDTMKYKNPPVSKNIIVFENQINWSMPIVLVEGVFDAIAIKQNAIPLLGKVIPRMLKGRLMVSGTNEITVLLDSDANAEALELVDILNSIPTLQTVKIGFVPENLDAGKLGFQNVWKYITSAETIDFKSLTSMKLYKETR